MLSPLNFVNTYGNTDYSIVEISCAFTKNEKENYFTEAFLTTDETISSWKVNGDFKGLKLPKEVVEKIYYKNAEKMFSGI